MTAPKPAPPRRREWWARPGVVLPLVGALVVLVALLTPQPSGGRLGDDRLSSHLAGSLGARALSETAARFGFSVSARDDTPVPDSGVAPGRTIHAVLAPPLALSPAEAGAYLAAVRGGDGLLVVIRERSPLSDSLRVRHTPDGGVLQTIPGDSVDCEPMRDLTPPLWPDGWARLYGLRWVRGRPADAMAFASVLRGGNTLGGVTEDAAVGFALGRGRVVVVSDPDLLRNDVLRRCEWGAAPIAMRMLEWLRAGGDVPRAALAFDEFHQGYGPTTSVIGTASRFLVGHPAGRTVLQVALAGLVLLAALGPRAIAPRDSGTIERRDPLEQVDALAHAYEQVGASRTATSRLLRGLRWRVEGTGSLARARSDDSFLSDAEAAEPTLASDIALIRRALRETVAARDLPHIGAALRRIEDTLTSTRA